MEPDEQLLDQSDDMTDLSDDKLLDESDDETGSLDYESEDGLLEERDGENASSLLGSNGYVESDGNIVTSLFQSDEESLGSLGETGIYRERQ
ncbi:hypothetical protein MMC28_008221 [Mycoblastus sanguinarius]|nr:hypothetical protein [Mycoblastus sanguinarius]